jgi:hypothetical protein
MSKGQVDIDSGKRPRWKLPCQSETPEEFTCLTRWGKAGGALIQPSRIRVLKVPSSPEVMVDARFPQSQAPGDAI